MKYLFSLFFVLILGCVNAQTADIKGFVSHDQKAIPFPKVQLNEDFKVIGNAEGEYLFRKVPYGNYHVIISSIGYLNLEFDLEVNQPEINLSNELKEDVLQLDAVVVTGNMRETMISKSPVKIEVIHKSFFNSNPVNSIIEALQLVNGVQEQINCGVCGTNDIHINGMEGPYTLVLIDGMPIVSGLSSVYGFNGIPTSLIDRVEIIKGPSSTLYGTEAVGGVVNIITTRPDQSPLFDVDARFNTHQELKTSFSVSPKIDNRVFTSLSADYYYNNYRMDFNKDGFTDVPLNNRISVFNKWQINDKEGNTAFTLAARYYNEDRFGGTMAWTHEFQGSDSIYGENIKTERYELIGSYTLPTANRNIRFDFSANQHKQESYYGDVNYNALQQILFSNLIWDKKIGRRNQLLMGISNKYQIYEDNTPSNTDENTYVPGVFAQNEFNWTDELILLGGIRFDYHQNHGLIFSPRFSLKKQFGSYSALRFNYGTGFRQVHLFTEDHAFVSGARDVDIVNELMPERSHNATLNFNHTYTVLGYGNLDIDIFYTYFQNKIIPDFDQDPNLIIYDNLDGYGITRGMSISINHKFEIPLRVRMGATLMDVYEMTTDDQGNEFKDEQFFAPKVSGIFAVSYDFRKAGLSFNFNGRVMGPQRLPEFSGAFARPDESPWYTIQNFQITKTFKNSNLEIYAGIKNVWNYTQPSPLIDPANPYGDFFDTSYAYGPLQVRRYFFGLRWSLDKRSAK